MAANECFREGPPTQNKDIIIKRAAPDQDNRAQEKKIKMMEHTSRLALTMSIIFFRVSLDVIPTFVDYY